MDDFTASFSTLCKELASDVENLKKMASLKEALQVTNGDHSSSSSSSIYDKENSSGNGDSSSSSSSSSTAAASTRISKSLNEICSNVTVLENKMRSLEVLVSDEARGYGEMEELAERAEEEGLRLDAVERSMPKHLPGDVNVAKEKGRVGMKEGKNGKWKSTLHET
jgi:hypothetical protein